MRRDVITDREALAKIRPKTIADQKKLWILGGYLALMIVFVVVVLFFQHRRRQEIESGWQSAAATIVDVRQVAALQANSQVGGAMLYQIEILANYDANDVKQQRWILIQQMPRPDPDKSQISRWKGKQCVVRWKASQPNQVIAELN
jgi:hypothetical protein